MLNAWLETLKQWNTVQGSAYHLREGDLFWNRDQQNLVSYQAALINETPVIYAVATPFGVAAGLPSKNLWLSLWGEIPEGGETGFVRAVEHLANQQRRSKIVFGGDEFHFVPGVPTDTAAGGRLKQALTENGFSGAESADFCGSLGTEDVDAYIRDARTASQSRNISLSRALSASTQEGLQMFLEKEFPGRWAREFQFWRGREDTARASWLALRDEADQVLGFARLAFRGKYIPLTEGWTPGALRLPLDKNHPYLFHANDGCLGPIGVATSQRGKGTGKLLLGLVLETLRQGDAERVCIDWTDAFKYYEPLRFLVARRYQTLWKST